MNVSQEQALQLRQDLIKAEADLRTLQNAVRNVRSAQARYFKERTPEWLHRSKELEKELDDLVAGRISHPAVPFANPDRGQLALLGTAEIRREAQEKVKEQVDYLESQRKGLENQRADLLLQIDKLQKRNSRLETVVALVRDAVFDNHIILDGEAEATVKPVEEPVEEEWISDPTWFAAGWVVEDVAYTVVCAEDGTPVSAVRRQGDQYRFQSCAVQLIAIREAQRIAYNYWLSFGALQEHGLQGHVVNHDATAIKVACGDAVASAPMLIKAANIGQSSAAWVQTPLALCTKEGNPARVIVQKWAEGGQPPVLENKYTARLAQQEIATSSPA